MSQPRNQCGTNHHDPHDQKDINAAKAAEVQKVREAMSKPDTRKVLLARYDRSVPR